jgi:fibronectin-binding autotransporter adhesin
VTLSGGSTATPNTVATTNNGAIGLYALSGGAITASGPITITTSGTTSTTTSLGAYGVNADGGNGTTPSQVNLAAATITTTGQGAVGLYASDVGATGQGGHITVSGALNVTTGTATGALPGAYGAWAQSAGSTIALNGASTFTINGAAFGLFASGSGAITTGIGSTLGVTINGGVGAGGVEASGSLSTVTLSGTTTIGLNGASNTGLFATTGGAITTEGPTSITASGATSTGVQATAGTVTATGTLNVTTSQASSVAFALAGASPSILATGGGTVNAAGNAINFIGATNAVATFDNFNITSASGDLIFADPSTATINFNNTTATANGGNLLNATAGSTIAFNANASTLTGAIQTDATSTTNVSLTNGTSWTMTGSSTMTSLNLTNSSVTFSPSGGFKTLTVGSLVGGTGANITLNTQLAGSQTDQIVINGGSATGTTALTIKNASANNAGAATTVPVVVVTNGGTTTTTAFKLASPVTAGGFQYALAQNPSNDDWYLTGSPVSTPENAITAASIQNSVNSLAQAQFNNMVTTRLLGSLLLGANEQISGCDCGGGFAGGGSFSLGSHGRWALSDSLTLLAGASWDSFYQDGTNVSASPIVAAALRYDPANWGSSRPFVEFGAAVSPYISASYTRYYNNGLTPATGVGSAIDRGLAIYGRVGWVARLTPTDEVAVLGDLVRGWRSKAAIRRCRPRSTPSPPP